MTSAAIAAVERLVGQYGIDAVIDALLEEVDCVPEEQLDAIEQMLDAVMAGILAEAGLDRTAA